jgi:putative transposase
MSRDAYYKKLARRHQRHVKEAVVLKVVEHIREDEPRVGTRKLQDKLQKAGVEVGRDRLFRLLRGSGKLVKPKKSFKRTTYSNHSYAVAENKVKELEIVRPRQVVVSDITYLRLSKEKFCYLFLVTDAFSRKILGYHVSKDLSHYSALLALDMASKEIGHSQATIHHSDRGCQYCCHEYLRNLNELGMVPSMTDENHCYQNAIAERVNGILKDEFNLDAVFESVTEAKRAVVKSIHVYNTKRTHWSLNLNTPEEVYEQAA